MNKRIVLTIVITLILIGVIVSSIILGIKLTNQNNNQTPDKIKVHLLGQKVSKDKSSLVFNKINISKSLQSPTGILTSKDGYYVCISGIIISENNKLFSENILLNISNPSLLIDNDISSTPIFKKDLTQTISTELRYDKDTETINNNICLVFEIDEEYHQLLFQNRESNEIGLSWEIQNFIEGKLIFGCLYSDIEYK